MKKFSDKYKQKRKCKLIIRKSLIVVDINNKYSRLLFIHSSSFKSSSDDFLIIIHKFEMSLFAKIIFVFSLFQFHDIADAADCSKMPEAFKPMVKL